MSVSAATTAPNVVVILADDLGVSDVGYGQPDAYYLTPQLDRLAARSQVFDSYVTMPTCAPARASLLTGAYPPRHGVYHVDAFCRTPRRMRRRLGGESPTALPAGTITMPAVFRDAGYRTHLVGKWHLGDAAVSCGGRPVFDTVVGRATGNEGGVASYFSPYGSNVAFEGDGPDYLTDRLTHEACAIIRDAARPDGGDGIRRPFFLFLSHYAPHAPLHARQADADLFAGRTPRGLQNRPSYAAMVYAFDRSVGAVVDELENQGLLDHTILLITSDNGGQVMSTSNAPYSGQKGEVLDGGVRAPALLWFAGIEPGVNHDLACVVDIWPTLAELTGVAIPDQLPIDGRSWLATHPAGCPEQDRAVFVHQPGYTGNGRSNALVWQPPVSVIRTARWKLVESLEEQGCRLYDLTSDIAEEHDVAVAFPDVVADLGHRLAAWRDRTAALVPHLDNPEFDPASRDWVPGADRRLEADHTNVLLR